MGSQPTGAPPFTEIDDHWRQFDNSVNAVSFGFVATAVLISMFLVMAIFERFLRPTSPESSPSGRRYIGDVESQMGFHGKLRFPSPKVSNNALIAYAYNVFVLYSVWHCYSSHLSHLILKNNRRSRSESSQCACELTNFNRFESDSKTLSRSRLRYARSRTRELCDLGSHYQFGNENGKC